MPGGRPKGIWTPELVRSRIRASQLINRLTDHVLGDAKMLPTQVQAALGLLKKVIPDTHQTAMTVTRVKRISYAERRAKERIARESGTETVEHTVQ